MVLHFKTSTIKRREGDFSLFPFLLLLSILVFACNKNNKTLTVHDVFKFDTLITECKLSAGYDVISRPASAINEGTIYFTNFMLLNDSGLQMGLYEMENRTIQYKQLPMSLENVSFLKTNLGQYSNVLLAASAQYIVIIIHDIFSIYEKEEKGTYKLKHQLQYKSVTQAGFVNDSTLIVSRLYNIGTNFIQKGIITNKGIDFSDESAFKFDFPNSVKVDYFCQYIDYKNNGFITCNSYDYKVYFYNNALQIVDSIYQPNFNMGKQQLIDKMEKKYAQNPIDMVAQLDKELTRVIAAKFMDETTVLVMYRKGEKKYFDIWQKNQGVWKLFIANVNAQYILPMSKTQVLYEPINFPNTITNAYNFGFYKTQLVTLCSGGNVSRYTVKKQDINQFFMNQMKNPCLNIDNYTFQINE